MSIACQSREVVAGPTVGYQVGSQGDGSGYIRQQQQKQQQQDAMIRGLSCISIYVHSNSEGKLIQKGTDVSSLMAAGGHEMFRTKGHDLSQELEVGPESASVVLEDEKSDRGCNLGAEHEAGNGSCTVSGVENVNLRQLTGTPVERLATVREVKRLGENQGPKDSMPACSSNVSDDNSLSTFTDDDDDDMEVESKLKGPLDSLAALEDSLPINSSNTEHSSEVARRRLHTIGSHLNTVRISEKSLHSQLETQSTSHADGNLAAIQQGYSVILPENLRTASKWNVYRSARSPMKLVDRFPRHPDIATLHDNFVHAVNSYTYRPYLGTRVRVDGTIGDYQWSTYAEAGTARTRIGSGLIHHGIPEGACVGIYMINRPEWIVIDNACFSYSYISVPLYDTLGPDAVRYIINHADISVVFCVNENLEDLLGFYSECPSVRLVVVVGATDLQEMKLQAFHAGKAKLGETKGGGIDVIPYWKLEEEGRSYPQLFRPPMPEDVATICYTSGSTGTPKGAVITHANFIAGVAGFSVIVTALPTDVHISYLPLAHIYERNNVLFMTYCGVGLGFYSGDATKLMDDVRVLRPTIFTSVPRIYNRIYSAIMNAVNASGVVQRRLFNMAFNARKAALAAKGSNASTPIWDTLVFNKIRATLGGRVRFMTCGSSPISAEVLEFMRICFGGRVSEGYGMTESTGTICACDEGDKQCGHVGSPNPACEVKLVDVPEMEYTCEDKPYPRGEICVRGPLVFKGYHKHEAQTRDIIDDDGWLHSGDIGLWLPGGRLKIIDRKKNIFKLSQGEYVAPEKIENVYGRSKFVAQCFVYGDSLSSCLVAVVASELDVLRDWAKSQRIRFEDVKELCNDSRVKAVVLADLNALGRAAELRGFEMAKAVTLVAEPFSMENGLLTPTLKIKRPQAKARFAEAIELMYSELATK